MTETNQPPASVFSALKLTGKDSKHGPLAGNPDKLSSSESPFSDELQRANSHVQKQLESQPDGAKAEKKGVSVTAGKNNGTRDTGETPEPFSHHSDASALPNDSVTELAGIKVRANPGDAEGIETTVAASDTNLLVSASRSDTRLIAKKNAISTTEEQLAVVKKTKVTEARDIEVDLGEKSVERATADSQALTQDAAAPAVSVNKGDSIQTTLAEKALTVSSSQPSDMSSHSGTVNVSPVIITQTDKLVDAASAEVKTQIPANVQPLPLGSQLADDSLPAAPGPITTKGNGVLTPHIDGKTLNVKGALVDTGVTSVTDLARSQALGASSSEELAVAPASNPLGVMTLKSTPGPVKNQSVLKEIPANQSVSELVESEVLDSGFEGVLLPKQVLQLTARSGQGLELMPQGTGAMLSEAASNMFQAVPGGIITAPVVQRSEPSANLLPNAPYTVPLMSPDADESLAGNVKWMMSDGVKNAVVNLSPSGMGPISVQVEIENKQMNVSIIAAQGATREALDAMLPRLRDQLGTQSLESVRVDISDGRSENTRNFNGQQFGQARGEFAGNDQNSNADAGDARQSDGSRDSSEAERQHINELQNTAIEMTNGNQYGQSLFDAYV